MEMTGGVFADRLVHQTQGELTGPERARVIGFGLAAGADVAHLSALQFGEAAAPGKGVPVEALVRMPPDESLHFAGEVQRLGTYGNCHDTLLIRRSANLRPPPLPAKGKSDGGQARPRDGPGGLSRKAVSPVKVGVACDGRPCEPDALSPRPTGGRSNP